MNLKESHNTGTGTQPAWTGTGRQGKGQQAGRGSKEITLGCHRDLLISGRGARGSKSLLESRILPEMKISSNDPTNSIPELNSEFRNFGMEFMNSRNFSCDEIRCLLTNKEICERYAQYSGGMKDSDTGEWY